MRMRVIDYTQLMRDAYGAAPGVRGARGRRSENSHSLRWICYARGRGMHARSETFVCHVLGWLVQLSSSDLRRIVR